MAFFKIKSSLVFTVAFGMTGGVAACACFKVETGVSLAFGVTPGVRGR